MGFARLSLCVNPLCPAAERGRGRGCRWRQGKLRHAPLGWSSVRGEQQERLQGAGRAWGFVLAAGSFTPCSSRAAVWVRARRSWQDRCRGGQTSPSSRPLSLPETQTAAGGRLGCSWGPGRCGLAAWRAAARSWGDLPAAACAPAAQRLGCCSRGASGWVRGAAS